MSCWHRSFRWFHSSGLALVAVGLLVSACGGAAKGADVKQISPDDRQRINTLLTQIQEFESEQTGGDVCGHETVGAVMPDSAGDGDGDGDGEICSPSRAPQTMSAAPARNVGKPPPPVVLPETTNKCFSQSDERSGRCGDVCRLAGSICDNAVSICRIARDLSGDTWARGRCVQASNACTRADQRCCQCS